MARYKNAKCRLCRREGIKLYLKGERCYTTKCALTRKNSLPGMHATTKRQMSVYGLQLREKQKVKRMYGMNERQFKKFFGIASKSRNKGLAFLQLLERRLDNILYRVGWAVSRVSARQMVSHGFVKVNGRVVNIPSFLVKVGDKIEITQKLWEVSRKSPVWLEVSKTSCTVKDYPTRKMLDPGIKENLIIEYYSK